MSPSITPPTAANSDGKGPLYALLAYGAWGIFPLYWKAFGTIPAVEILCHRMMWSMLLLWGILAGQGQIQQLRQVWNSPRQWGRLGITAAILSVNWGLYIYGVNSDRVIETSLGYFINPLVNVLLGFVVLGERLSRAQQGAVGLAIAAVGIFISQLGQVPWIALALAFSFGMYGLLRKTNSVKPLVGLTVETTLLAPIALGVILYETVQGQSHFTQSPTITLLFIGCGLVTSAPLLWFNHAAQRLTLSTLGFFQYLAPSIQLLLGVALYREPFTTVHGLTFGLIWSALALYAISSLKPRI